MFNTVERFINRAGKARDKLRTRIMFFDMPFLYGAKQSWGPTDHVKVIGVGCCDILNWSLRSDIENNVSTAMVHIETDTHDELRLVTVPGYSMTRYDALAQLREQGVDLKDIKHMVSVIGESSNEGGDLVLVFQPAKGTTFEHWFLEHYRSRQKH